MALCFFYGVPKAAEVYIQVGTPGVQACLSRGYNHQFVCINSNTKAVLKALVKFKYISRIVPENAINHY